MSTQAVVGRHAELGRISAFLAGIGDGAAALVLSGAPGVGKTVLWERGVAQAVSRGQRVLAHRAVEAEAGLAFTGLADLLTPVLDDVLPALAPPRRRALAVALLLEDAGHGPPDVGAIGLAVMDTLRVLADSAQVVVAVDDIQWLDSSTARVLPLALRRLDGEDVGMLATLRAAPEVRASFDLARTFGRLEDLTLDPLGLGELHRLLKDRLGLELSRPDLVRVLETSGGNPFFALEIGREFAGTQGAIRVPASLRQALGTRLARLSAQTMDPLLAVAASARPTVELTLSAACDAPREAVLDALDAAAREGVVVLDDERVRFTHPLLASLCYEQTTPWKRRAVHGRLAAVVEDPEERARHLALSVDGADAAVAAELEAAARHAATRGATAAAAELAEMAAARTPPTDAVARRRRQRSAADFHHLAGDFGKATELLAALAEELPPGLARADVLHARARIGRDDLPTRARLAEQALQEAGDDDALAAQILGFLAIHRWVLGSVPDGVRDARRGLARAERLGDPRVLAIAIAGLGFLEMLAGELTPGLLERGADIEAGLDEPLLFIQSSSFMLAVHMMSSDRLDRARSMFEEFIQSAVAHGDEHTRQWAVLQLITINGWAGRFARALEYAAEARAISEQTHEIQYRGMVESYAALIEADTGLLEQARRSGEEGLRDARSVGDESYTIGNLAALGHLELVRGDMRAASSHLRELPERVARTGEIGRSRDFSADAIEALIGVGDLDLARRYSHEYLDVLPRLNRRSFVAAWRSAGLLAAAAGDRTDAIDALERAVAADGDPPMYPMERARTLLALGSVQRQALQRRAARQTLERALAIFEGLGAPPWAQKAREELRRISGRRAASDELTEAEHRVALLAAGGRHNKEIAAELYLSVGTVEHQLTSAYRKLGVRSRTELAGRLAKPGDEPTKR
jgi:DNA-binding CsgD family transcriptional regulator